MIIVSLILVTVTNTLYMTSVEGKAFTVIKKLNKKNSLKEKAAVVITKAARLHLQIKHKKKIMKHEIIDLGESIEEFYLCRRQYKNIKDIGQNQIGEIIKEFSLVQKTNQETMLYISSLANMVSNLKIQNKDLRSKLGVLEPSEKDAKTNESQLERLEGILQGLHDSNDYKWLKEHLILREFVSAQTSKFYNLETCEKRGE